jgi:hypothetical protein
VLALCVVPDFTQVSLQSSTYPVRVTVVLGPANTRPDSPDCIWRFDFFIFS